MKNIILITILLISVNLLSAQRIVRQPRYSASSDQSVQIAKIEFSDLETTLELVIRKPEGSGILVSSKMYIQSSDGGKKLYVQKSEGIELEEEYYLNKSNRKTIKLHFPALDKNVNRINLRSGEKGSNWQIFEIIVNPQFRNEVLPKPEIGYREANGKKWKYIINPKYAAQKGAGLKLVEIELKDTVTIVHFEYNGRPNNWIYIPSQTCIQAGNSKELLYVTGAEGITFDKKVFLESGEIAYALHFPKLDKKVKTINFKEVNSGGNWFIFEIEI
jgi:hypothetical protein